MITGRRPAPSLRRPQAGLTNTHSDAEVAKMVETWNGVMPISRAAGGRIENSIDCPMPTETRQAKSRPKSRRKGDRAASSWFRVGGIRPTLAEASAETLAGHSQSQIATIAQ